MAYWNLRFPNWEGPVYLVFLLFLDYKIQGGKGLLSLYMKKYSESFVFHQLEWLKMVPLGLIVEMLSYKEKGVFYCKDLYLETIFLWEKAFLECDKYIGQKKRSDGTFLFSSIFGRY